MAKRIVWTTPAGADVRRIAQQTAMRVLEGLARYAAHDEGDVRRLTGIDPPNSAFASATTASAFITMANGSKSSESSRAAKPTAADLPSA